MKGPPDLLGPYRFPEREDNIRATELKLDAEVLDRINKVSQTVPDKPGSNPDYYENSRKSRIY